MHKILGLAAAAALLAVPFTSFAAVAITLQGGAVTVNQGQSYVEPGYSAQSTVNGNVTNNVLVANPGTSQFGTFSVQYSVSDVDNTDPAHPITSTDTKFRTLTVNAVGSLMPFCSGPMAPGWQTGVPGGGCGGTGMTVPAGSDGCPFWFPNGCLKE